jgi:kynurenine 3-monooxygenase
MSESGSPRVLIVGAGLAGTLMACYLARAGNRVRVYERRGDPRAAGYVGGRSINLALSARGLWGLAGVGLDSLVMERDAIPMKGRMIHPLPRPGAAASEVKTVFQPYSADPKDAINSVSRGGLNLTLLNAADDFDGVEFVFDHPCLDVDLEAPAAVFERPGGGTVRVEADLVIGADGAFSAVRGRMQKTDRFEYSQSYLQHGYKELQIPSVGGEFAMEVNALHIWPRGSSMMIALPNRDRSFTCTLFWPFEGEHGLNSLRTSAEVRAFFERHYPDAVPLMPTLERDYFANPTSSLVTIHCSPWVLNGKVALIGDAAHAIVPFYGQGMNAAFEDCRVLAACLEGWSGDRASLAERLDRYQHERKPHADAIAEMALENFVEMRDKVGQPAFLYKKKLEQAVHQLFPDRVTPQYNLVSFSTVPYAEARRRGRELDASLQRVVAVLPPESLKELGEERWRERVREVAGPILGGAVPGAVAGGMPAPPEQSQLLDITPAITEKLGVWPSDTPPSREVLCDIARGDTVTLSTLRATVHLGAHADGPNHYGLGARSVGEQPLDRYIGRCQVVTAKVGRGQRVQPGDLAGGINAVSQPRVLIRTGTFPDPNSWNSDFAGLSVELVDALASRGVVTIGTDAPSVDLQDSKDLPAHKAILRHDIAILEGLALDGVADGVYELFAQPLKLMGFDGSPVRAVLRAV